MLRDIEELMGGLSKWAIDHPIVGFAVMGFVAGIVATLRIYERAGIEFTWRLFAARCVTKGLMGLFVAVLLFFGWRAMAWSLDWGFLASGICGVFATDVLEIIFVTGVAFLRKRFGITQADINTTPAPEPDK